MDDAGHRALATAGFSSRTASWTAVGAGREPEADERVDLAGAVVTPGLVNTHHHLYQTLTRARGAAGHLFEWLVELYPTWARIDAEAEYAAARTGLAELVLSGCTTVFDHHYVFPRGRTGSSRPRCGGPGARLPHRRLPRVDGPRRVGRRAAARRARRGDRRRARRHRAARRRPARERPGARVQIAVAPCSPFSVTGRLMTESADVRAQARAAAPHAPRRDGRGGGVLPRALRLLAGRVPRPLGWLDSDVWWRTASTSPGGDRPLRARPAPASRTARRRTSGSARASRPCERCSTRASASASASTARPRTSAATCSST